MEHIYTSKKNGIRVKTGRLSSTTINRTPEQTSQLQAKRPPTFDHDFSQVKIGDEPPLRRVIHTIQPKLTIGQPNDKYEQEAEGIADQIIRTPAPRIQRDCPDCEEEKAIQAKLVMTQITPLAQQGKPSANRINPLIQRQAELEFEEEDVVQPKLRIGQPNDKYEQEADRVADQVMRMPEPTLQRQPLEEEEEENRTTPAVMLMRAPGNVQRQMMVKNQFQQEKDTEQVLQTKPFSRKTNSLTQQRTEGDEEREVLIIPSRQSSTQDEQDIEFPDSETQIRSQETGGQRLPDRTRVFFEARFGRDFSAVRVHTGTKSAALNNAISAYAFTYGNHIWLGRGLDSQPSNLLAHELVHVIQQTQPPVLQQREELPQQFSPLISPLSDTSRRDRVQRFAPYWEPLNVRGTQTHDGLLTEIASHGQHQGILHEIWLPNADRNGSGYGKKGKADLYKASPNATVGVYFTNRGVPMPLSSNGGRAPASPRGPRTRRLGRRSSQHITHVDEAPSRITIGDLKPSHGTIEAARGAEQIASYEDGLGLARDEVNEMVRRGESEPPDQRWNLTTSPFSRADLRNLIPRIYRYPAMSQAPDRVILKLRGRPVRARSLITMRARQILYPDPTNRGVLNYVWVPISVPTTVLPASIREMGVEVVRDVLNPLRASPVQQQIARKAKQNPINKPVFSIPVRQKVPSAIYPVVRDSFDFRRWRDRRSSLSRRFRGMRGSAAYRDASGAALVADAHRAIQSRTPFTIPDLPQQTRSTATTFERAEFWTSRRAGVFGSFRRIFGRVFVRIMNAYEGMRERFRRRLRQRIRPGGGSGLLGAAIKAVFSVVKMAGIAVIRQTIRVLGDSLRRGVREKLRSLIGHENIEEFEERLQEVRQLRDQLQSDAVQSAQQFIDRTIRPYTELIDQVDTVRRVIETTATIINMVRWGARAIACLSPPAVGCLWALAQAVLEQAAALVVQTCWFKERITPWTLRLAFVRNLPRNLATLIIRETRRVLPRSLHDVFAEPETPSLRQEDVECERSEESGRAPTAEQLAVYELQQGLGEERFRAFLELSRQAGLPASTPLTAARARQIRQTIEQSGATADDLSRYATQYREDPSSIPVGLRAFLERASETEGAEVTRRGQETAENLQQFTYLEVGDIRITYTGSLEQNQTISGFLAARARDGILVGGNVTFTPIRQLSGRSRWRVRVEPGWQRFNERGQFLNVIAGPMELNWRHF